MGGRRIGVIAACLTFAWLLYEQLSPVEAHGGQGRLPVAVDESSGLVASLTNPGILWTHNDSGAQPVIYAITLDGRLKGVFTVEGVGAEDWEAVTTDLNGHLYVGDFGNNRNERRNLVVYRVAEPRVSAANTAVVHGSVDAHQAIPFHFPEQTAFPQPNRINFDAEALFWAPHPETGEGTLYVLTKHRSDTKTSLYRFDDLSGPQQRGLSLVGQFDVGGDPRNFGGQVTGADISVDGRTLAILTYHAIFIFQRPTVGDNYLSSMVNRIPLDQSQTQQTEGIAWLGEKLIITNEQGRIFVITGAQSSEHARVWYEGDF
ncbi:MAG: hypothetical protein VX589_16520 [Myxococcota bacterium]|nr:hypothetical protein [Myxococcota bacterium]